MRIFYLSLLVFIALVAWLLNKPIPRQAQVARAFTDAEVEYLEKSFDYAMETLKSGDHFDWSTAGVNGRISASELFMSSQKADCRHYVEIMRTADAQRTENGLACKRASADGWCRIGYNVPPSCALETLESSVAKRARYAIMQGTQVIDSALGTKVDVSTDGLAPPKPNMPNMPSAPSVGLPDISPKDFHPTMPWEFKKK